MPSPHSLKTKYFYLLGIILTLIAITSVTLFKYSKQAPNFDVYAQSASFTNQFIDGYTGRVALGDFNGDGRDDIALHQWSANRGSGGRTSELLWFESPNWTRHKIDDDYFWGDWNEAADVDKDGRIDIVTTASNGQTRDYQNIYLYRNTGGGNFNKITIGTHTGAGEVRDLHVADFDGDGRNDIITRHARQVIVYYGTGNTSFTKGPTVTLNTGAEAEGLGILDVNKDGRLDAVLEGYWLSNPGNRSSNWTRNNFDSYWYGNEPSGYRGYSVKVYIANIDGQGGDDIIISDSENNDQAIRWYSVPNSGGLNTSNANPQTITNRTGYISHTLAAADFDGDGDIDVFSAGLPRPNSQHFIYYNPGNGTGNWQQQTIPGSGPGYSGKIGDVNGDGKPDIVNGVGWDAGEIKGGGINYPGPIRIQIFINQASGTFPTPTPGTGSCEIQLNSWQTYSLNRGSTFKFVFVLPGDIDGDGLTDIIAGDGWWKNPGSINNNWSKRTIGGAMSNIGAVADFDGDGDQDIIGTNGRQNGNQIIVATNNGSGNFQVRSIGSVSGGDFLQGLATANYGNGTEVALSWHKAGVGIQLANPRTGQIRNVSNNSTDEQLSAGDIDGDGDQDLLQGTKWLENRNGNFIQHTLNPANANAGPDRNRLADINGDGKLDAIVGYEAINIPGRLAWYEQTTATGTWTERIISNSVIGPMSLDVADMNGDGDLDVIVGEHNYANASQAKLFIFENQGGGNNWQQYTAGQGQEHHDGAQVADFDNDGDLDIVSIGWNNNQIYIYENTSECDNSTQPTPTIPFGTTPTPSGPIPTQAPPPIDPDPGPTDGDTKSLQPGAIYREYTYVTNPDGGRRGEWRVTGTDASASGANQFLPNKPLRLNVDDLQGAESAELMISMWGGHANTRDKKIRVNGNSWIPVPKVPTLPADNEPNYMFQWNPIIDIPLSQLRSGNNTFEADACGPTCGGSTWPQWGWTGITLRIYYNASKAGAPDVSISNITSGQTISHNQTITTASTGQRTDIIGYYNGIDEDGDGYYTDWHYDYIVSRNNDRVMDIKHHIGTGSSVTWDTSLVPNQQAGGIKLIARSRAANGLWKVSPIVDNLSLTRDFSVYLFPGEDVPPRYNPRASRSSLSNQNPIPQQYLASAQEAYIYTRTWAQYVDRLTVNGANIKGNIYQQGTLSTGFRNYAYGYNYLTVPVATLQPNNTTTFTYAGAEHGVEVLWPGPSLLITTDQPVDAGPPLSCEGELVIYDSIRNDPLGYEEFSYNDNGFHTIKKPGEDLPFTPPDWTSPVDYRGEWHFRQEIIKPSNNPGPGKLQICFWGNAENCTAQIPHPGEIGVYTGSRPYNEWWRNGGALNISDQTPFTMRVVLRGPQNPSGCNVTRYNVAGSCPELFPNFEGMQFRTTIIAVPAGQTFSGWENYPPGQAVANCNPQPTATPPPDPNQLCTISCHGAGFRTGFCTESCPSSAVANPRGMCSSEPTCCCTNGVTPTPTPTPEVIAAAPTAPPPPPQEVNFAQTPRICNLTRIVEAALKITLSIAGLTSFIMITYAGFLWLTAGGDDQQLINARSTMTWGVIGLALSIGAFFILILIEQFTGMELTTFTIPWIGNIDRPDICR